MKHEHHENQHHHEYEEQPCSCGHDHIEHHHQEKKHHHEEHQHGGLGHHELTITHHENAVIVSAEREIRGDYNRVKEAMTRGLKDLADWVESQNGLVGHIKAHLSEKGYSAMLSTTGDDVQIKESDKQIVTVNLAVIVFVDNEEGLAEQVSQLLKEIVNEGCQS